MAPEAASMAVLAPVPTRLAQGFRRALGVDVSPVMVHRDQDTSSRARDLGARAYTRDGEVFVPAEAGGLDEPATRGLLAHELTHLTQQQVFGPALPAESSRAGRALEAEAVANERAFATETDPPALLAGVPFAPGRDLAVATPPTAVAQRAPAVQVAPAVRRAPVIQRAPVDVVPSADELHDLMPDEVADTPSEPPAAPDMGPSSWVNPDGAAMAAMFTDAGAATGQPAPDAAELAESMRELRASVLAVQLSEEQAHEAAAQLRGEVAALAVTIDELPAGRGVDLDDASSVERLAARLYPGLRGRLRQELLVDRERHGILADL